jgi:UDP-glucose 4-epimerase
VNLLLTGGAGYVGSVLAARLISAGHDVTVLDDLSTGRLDSVPAEAQLVQGDVRTAGHYFRDHHIDAVLHVAAKSLVADSVADPSAYWRQNLSRTVALLEAMHRAQIRRIVFSSTAAAYGEPGSLPITESAVPRPANAYGGSKLAADIVLTEHARIHGIGAVSLRYFNVAGAYHDVAGRWQGERHEPETHLIPSILASALAGGRLLSIHGTDYPTPDGTCIRDYVHVTDVAEAHLLALDACIPGQHLIYNLGSGAGFSNLEVLAACRRVTHRAIPARLALRRPGDLAVLIASADRIRAELRWQSRLDLDAMAGDAWAFMLSRSSGLARSQGRRA